MFHCSNNLSYPIPISIIVCRFLPFSCLSNVVGMLFYKHSGEMDFQAKISFRFNFTIFVLFDFLIIVLMDLIFDFVVWWFPFHFINTAWRLYVITLLCVVFYMTTTNYVGRWTEFQSIIIHFKLSNRCCRRYTIILRGGFSQISITIL